MALFSVYAPATISDSQNVDAPVVVPDRFSWFATLLPPLFLLVHRLWLALLAWALGLAALLLAAPWLGIDAAFWLYVLGALWIGFEAPLLRRSKLEKSGFAWRGEIVAADPDIALHDYLKLAA